MNKLKVNEIFYSLQGEGIRSGTPSIFIRLTDCNLTCGFCDTEFTSGKDLSYEEILNKISDFPCKEIVWTGGEPALQLNNDVIIWFKQKGYYQCIETNGSKKIPDEIDFITLSPKVAEHVLQMNFENGVTEIKYVRHKGQLVVPNTQIKAKHYYISPMCDGNQINKENLNHCINLILKNPKWKLTLQNHKIWKVI